MSSRAVIFNTIKSAVEISRHIPRYREILYVLWKYGFGNILRLMMLQKLLNIEEQWDAQIYGTDILEKPLPVRIRLALEELGPTFIKFGQIVSSRRDLVTDPFYDELIKLQNEVPPFSSETAKAIVKEELGHSVDELFLEFSDEPIGGASIAQVHRGKLHDGREVAIKIQRPNIAKTIELDLEILKDLARFVEKHSPEIAVLNPSGVVTEFAETLAKELDFENEALNAERFRKLFIDDATIKVPKVFRDYSTTHVLTMEFISGIRVNDLEKLAQNQIDPVVLSENITRLIYRQIFEFGFFHGDPHPGNITVLPEGIIGLYDFGMMGSFTPSFRESIAMMIMGLAEKDHQQTMRALLDMSEEGHVADTRKMLADVEYFSEQHLNQPLRDIQLSLVLDRLLELLRRNKLRMKSNFYLGIKALAQVEAIGQELNPDLNFIVLGEPYATSVLKAKFAPGRMMEILKHILNEGVDVLRDFPHDFRTVYENFKQGRFNVPLEHKIDPKGFEPLRTTMDSIANRFTIAILTASVLICSSIVVLAHVPPLFRGVSLPGIIGLCFGTYMCLRLVFTIWKHGGL